MNIISRLLTALFISALTGCAIHQQAIQHNVSFEGSKYDGAKLVHLDMIDEFEKSISCGTIKRIGSGLFVVSNETLDIPYITIEEKPDFYFGCKIIKYGEFEAKYKIEMPKKTAFKVQYAIGSESNSEYNNESSILETNNIKFIDYSNLLIQLNKDEIPGSYKVEIFVNDISIKSVSFNVYELP